MHIVHRLQEENDHSILGPIDWNSGNLESNLLLFFVVGIKLFVQHLLKIVSFSNFFVKQKSSKIPAEIVF